MSSPMETLLPMDIISTHILPRLPTKSLVRFKCVSKSFNSLISSEHFINLHTLLYKQPNPTFFLSGINSTLYSINLNSLVPAPLRFPLSGFFTPVPNSNFEVVGSCNGLLCIASLCYRDSHHQRISTLNSLLLINPFTRNFREIPFHHLPGSICSVGLGFGFDDVNHDYKIMSMVELIDSGCVKYTVVYSLNANTWKFIPHRISSRERLEHHSWSVCVNNRLVHFLYFGDYNCRIGCFDLRTEEWAENVPLPEFDPVVERDAVVSSGDNPVCLRVLDGCLCFGDLRDRRCVDVWIMKEYGVKESWDLFRVSLVGIGRNIKTLEMVSYRDGEILLKKRGMSHLIVVYNIEDERVGKVQLNGVAPFSQGYECKESLTDVPWSDRTEPPENVGLTDEMQVVICELPPWIF